MKVKELIKLLESTSPDDDIILWYPADFDPTGHQACSEFTVSNSYDCIHLEVSLEEMTQAEEDLMEFLQGIADSNKPVIIN